MEITFYFEDFYALWYSTYGLFLQCILFTYPVFKIMNKQYTMSIAIMCFVISQMLLILLNYIPVHFSLILCVGCMCFGLLKYKITKDILFVCVFNIVLYAFVSIYGVSNMNDFTLWIYINIYILVLLAIFRKWLSNIDYKENIVLRYRMLCLDSFILVALLTLFMEGISYV